ncbi:MFS transporter [Kibdelosporangium aridum]|uniref:Predicted arabinose efflux permease, MFS family n=1 Tax=Kibdelosporangium aridum TaxID=2030 RepID=A0A1W2FLZ6_KIBAR|nr:MFS transporter [Kibdelosporangium aridum]SMD22999.1 Predicted arabinose efflux permease, MFS family [Kibdelosporangium aridum]
MPLARYLLAATIVRTVDGGAAVGLVALAAASNAGAVVGGLLVAALSAPHVLGFLTAPLLDRAADGRKILAIAFTAYAVALGFAAVSLGHVPLAVSIAMIVLAGTCGPMLTGGLSSQLAGIAADQRRAEGLDSLTYGVGSTLGPAMVTGLVVLLGPRFALLVCAAAAVVAAVMTLFLPRQFRVGQRDTAIRISTGLALLWRSAPLRRVATATTLMAVGLGALPVVTVLLATQLNHGVTGGGIMVAVFGAGSLAGSLAVTVHPHKTEAEKLVIRYVTAMGIALIVAALAPSYLIALIAVCVAGVMNGPFVAATLAARSDYAPENARAQVFITFAGMKIAAAAAGAALAGVLSPFGGHTTMTLAAAIVLAGALVSVADRWTNARRKAANA